MMNILHKEHSVFEKQLMVDPSCYVFGSTLSFSMSS